MTYKALAIDLDGTLLVGEALPEANRKALAAAAAAGLRVIIATARWKEMAFRIQDAAGISGPVIACSGAQVHDRPSGQDLFDRRLPAAFTDALYAICNQDRCVATITVDERVLLKLDGKPSADLLQAEMDWVPQLDTARGLPRIAAIQGSAVNQRIREELAPRFGAEVNFFDSIGPTGKIIITLTAKGATKGAALQAACAQLNLAPAEVIAFGDAENDLSMFAAAGRAVAMGQADDRVKAAAHHVTGRNDEAGVAQVIEHLLHTGELPGAR